MWKFLNLHVMYPKNVGIVLCFCSFCVFNLIFLGGRGRDVTIIDLGR